MSAASRPEATTPEPALRVPLAMLYRWSPRQLVAWATLGAALITACAFAPRFWLWPAAGHPLGDLVTIQPELNRAYFALQQLHDPWQRIDDHVNRVIEWRLFWPVIAHYAGLPARLYLALPHLGCLLALALAGAMTWQATRDALATVCAAFLTASASWFFVSTGWLAYFDSWLVLTLLLASFARGRAVLFAAALIAPWIDERFILALPLCLGVRALNAGASETKPARDFWRDALALALGIAPYLAVRVGAELTHARQTSSSYWSDRPLFPAGPWALTLGVWHGLRLGWVLAAAALAALGRSRRWLAIAAIVLSLIVNLLVADDLSRSMSIATPVLLAGLICCWRADARRAARIVPWLCIGNLVLPATHILATPDSPIETFHRVPILSVVAEAERMQNPPDFANPATYNRRAMDFFSLGKPDAALAMINLGLCFDPAYWPLHANRGIVQYMSQHQAEGLAELDHALEMNPYMYDARMQRGAFRQQQGNIAGALEDVQEALHFMPADWPKRKNAEQFERSLAAQLGH